ncbi:MAG: RNA ligase family protein [Actinomycetota bacterium]|nr:RNA ligase family protein [Actinomycetota bacterium]
MTRPKRWLPGPCRCRCNVELPAALQGKDAAVDGEIIAMDDGGRPSFGRLQDRLGGATSDVASRVARTPVHLMLFDILDIQGETATDRSYLERRELLESLVVETRRVHVPPSYQTDLDSALAISKQNGHEGVVAKRPESPYRSGSRSDSWRKIKHEQFQEVVLVGWAEGAAGGLGSLVVAVPADGGGLRYAGRVGPGFSEAERARLHEALLPLSRTSPAVAHIPRPAGAPVSWVEPSLVGEVRFSEWTSGAACATRPGAGCVGIRLPQRSVRPRRPSRPSGNHGLQRLRTQSFEQAGEAAGHLHLADTQFAFDLALRHALIEAEPNEGLVLLIEP